MTDAERVQQLWSRWKSERTIDARNALVEQYMNLVGKIASTIKAGMPKSIDLGDMVQNGVFGLIDALERYEPGRGVKFDWYASLRIRGMILEGIRNDDWTPRLRRERQRKVRLVTDQLSQQYGRPVGTDEAVELGLVTPAIAADTADVGLVSLSRKRFETDDGRIWNEADMLSSESPGPDESMEINDFWSKVTRGLDRRTALMLVLYWREEMTMKEIGCAIGVTESRVSQLMKRSKRILADKLHGDDPAELKRAA